MYVAHMQESINFADHENKIVYHAAMVSITLLASLNTFPNKCCSTMSVKLYDNSQNE